jgi:hypothetical protein
MMSAEKHSLKFKIRYLDNGCLVVFFNTDADENGNSVPYTSKHQIATQIMVARSLANHGDYVFDVEFVNNFDDYGYFENAKVSLVGGSSQDWDI